MSIPKLNFLHSFLVFKFMHSLSAVPTNPPLASFLELYKSHYNNLNSNNSTSLYYNGDSIPYTTLETLYVDQSVDYGHLTTIKEFSYKLWTEALQGKISGKWKPFVNAWNNFENNMIPKEDNQKGCKLYYSTIYNSKNTLDTLYNDLNDNYKSCSIYLPHYKIDTDNWNRFFSSKNKYRFINTYKNNEKDSTWSSLTYPSIIIKNNFKNPYINYESKDIKQWEYNSDSKYTSKIIESVYWANKWSTEQKKNKFMSVLLKKIKKMSEYMLYFINDDNSFQAFNTKSTNEEKNYLLSRFFSWKGDINGKWLNKTVTSNTVGIGSQNPFMAYILSNNENFKSENPYIVEKWKKSYKRQIEFIRWLQSSEGAIVGNAQYPSKYDLNKESQFYDLVFSDIPNEENNLFSTQCYVFESLAELYYITKDKDVKIILQKWLKWVLSVFHLTSDRSFKIPNKLSFEGKPKKWIPNTSIEMHKNKNFNVIIEDYNSNIGVAASLAKILLWVGKKDKNEDYLVIGRDILEKIELLNKDKDGYAATETFYEYRLFNKKLPIKEGFKGIYGRSSKINDKSTFISIRPYYKHDKNWKMIDTYLNKGIPAPVFRYHKFWEQCEILLAQGLYSQLYKKYYPEPKCCKPYVCESAKKLGYRCCNSCEIKLIDENIKYGYENGEWCGIPDECYEPTVLCRHATRFGFPCCDTCSLLYIDDFGNWGFENDNWCGLSPNLCDPFYVEKNRKCQNVEGYYCCEGCKVEAEEDNIKYGYENNNWCIIPYSCSN